jgi:hypothetical protein
MKTTSLITMLIWLQLAASSQNCKFDYNKVDPLSNAKEQRITLRANVFFNLAFYHKGDDYRLESYVWMPGVQDFKIPVGHKLEVKLSNGKMLTLENAAEASPVSNVSGEAILTNYAMTYKITKEQYEEIAASGIAFTRTWLKETNYYDYEFKKKEIEKTMAFASCILGK